ncbi:MAG: helix-turn-helix transcriptional regulator, partial [Actinomycetes bacterium]
AEYSGDEPHTFATLARRRRPVAKLSDLPAAERRRSARLQTVWRPLGVDEELRVMFLVGGTCWGGAGMVRAGCTYTDRETAFLCAVAPALATATRLAVRVEAEQQTTGRAPAVVIVDCRDDPHATTPAAREWREGLDEIAPGRFGVMMQVMAQGARSTLSGSFRGRFRDGRGQWASLHASRLIGADDEDQVAIVIEPVTGTSLQNLLFAAYGLTAREREVCREVLAGHTTAEIADQLFISNYTVQDHLKAVFAKAGTRSRAELAAKLRAA